MNQPNASPRRIAVALGIAMAAGLMGCVGYVGDPGVGVAVVAPGPVEFWGGPVGWGHRGGDRDYGRRGGESRGAAHPARHGDDRRR
jgi:hypothetical protein